MENGISFSNTTGDDSSCGTSSVVTSGSLYPYFYYTSGNVFDVTGKAMAIAKMLIDSKRISITKISDFICLVEDIKKLP